MINTPKISVIIPIYNAEKYLKCCIDSILAQNFSDFELLLVDDGSSDNSWEICEEYAQKDSRVRVFHKENGGVSSARNVGLENALGEWLYFSDSDDELYSDAFEILLKNVSNDIAYVMAGYVIYNDAGEETYSITTRRTDVVTAQNAISQMFKPQDYLYHGYLWNKLFRTDIIKKHALHFEENIHFNEDRLFNVLYLLKIGGMKCVYTTEPVYKYIERDGSAMSTLQIDYNPKFATDLTAFIQMLRALKAERDYKNIKLCKRQTFYSYVYNIYLMKKFGVYTKEWENKLFNELKQQLLITDIVYFQSRRWLGRLKLALLKGE